MRIADTLRGHAYERSKPIAHALDHLGRHGRLGLVFCLRADQEVAAGRGPDRSVQLLGLGVHLHRLTLALPDNRSQLGIR
jgi:hypothetical protein